MLTKITLIVALCSGVSFHDVQKRVHDLQQANPGTVVSVRVDKKAACSGDEILTGKDARLLSQLGK